MEYIEWLRAFKIKEEDSFVETIDKFKEHYKQLEGLNRPDESLTELNQLKSMVKNLDYKIDKLLETIGAL